MRRTLRRYRSLLALFVAAAISCGGQDADPEQEATDGSQSSDSSSPAGCSLSTCSGYCDLNGVCQTSTGSSAGGSNNTTGTSTDNSNANTDANAHNTGAGNNSNTDQGNQSNQGNSSEGHNAGTTPTPLPVPTTVAPTNLTYTVWLQSVEISAAATLLCGVDYCDPYVKIFVGGREASSSAQLDTTSPGQSSTAQWPPEALLDVHESYLLQGMRVQVHDRDDWFWNSTLLGDCHVTPNTAALQRGIFVAECGRLVASKTVRVTFRFQAKSLP